MAWKKQVSCVDKNVNLRKRRIIIYSLKSTFFIQVPQNVAKKKFNILSCRKDLRLKKVSRSTKV